MGSSLPGLIGLTPRANAEKPLKADLRKAENGEMLAEIGRCLDAARVMAGWSLDRLALELGRDARQVSRWVSGQERTQVDVVWGVAALREPFVLALSKSAGADVQTEIRFRRTA